MKRRGGVSIYLTRVTFHCWSLLPFFQSVTTVLRIPRWVTALPVSAAVRSRRWSVL